MDIENVGFTTRTTNILKREGINNMEHLSELKDGALLTFKNLSREGFEEIKEAISDFKGGYKMEPRVTKEVSEERRQEAQQMIDKANATLAKAQEKLKDGAKSEAKAISEMTTAEFTKWDNERKQLAVWELIGRNPDQPVDDNEQGKMFEDSEVAIKVTYGEIRTHLEDAIERKVSDEEIDELLAYMEIEEIVGDQYTELANESKFDEVYEAKVNLLQGYALLSEAGGSKRCYAVPEAMMDLYGLEKNPERLIAGATYVQDVFEATGKTETTVEDENVVIDFFNDHKAFDPQAFVEEMKAAGLQFED